MKTKFKYIIAVTIILITILILFLLKTPDKLKGNIAMLKSENISISISDVNTNDSGAIEFLYDSGIKQVTVVADFKDTTSSGKKLEIVLNEGLTYKSYQVFEKQNYLETEFSDGVIKDSIENIERPTYVEDIKYNANLDSRYTAYGNLVYHIKEDKEKIEITFNISVDMYKFYGSKLIEDALTVNLYKENEIIDTIETSVNIKGDYKISFSNLESSTNIIKVFSSSEDNISYGQTMTTVSSNSYGLMLPFYRKAVYTLYYYDNTTLESIVFSNRSGKTTNPFIFKEGISEDKCVSVENYDDEKKVVITVGNDNPNNGCYDHYLTSGIKVKYKVSNYEVFDFSDITETKLYDIKGSDELEVTYYDGTKINYIDNSKEKVEIFHPLNNNNLLTIKTSNKAYDDYDNDTIASGPFFGVFNITPGEKVNQTFEFEIEESYEAVSVIVPRHKDSKVTKAFYKTNKKDWTEHTNLNTPLVDKYRIRKDDVKLDEDEFFTGAKITIDKFPENYQSHIGSPKASYNAVVYGNLRSDVNESSVKFKICNDNNSCVEDTKTISRPTNMTCSIRNAGLGFKDITTKEFIKTINSGENFLLTGELGLHGYPYGNSTIMKNVNIYLRQPKGLTINTANIELYDRHKNKITPEISSIKRDNDTLYILKTNADIGYYKNYESYIADKPEVINIIVPYTIDKGSVLSSVNTNELIFYGNENYGISQGFPSIIDDINDMDNNPSTKKITSPTSQVLTIQPDKSFLISLRVIKDGITYSSYNEYNNDTIIELSKNENIEYGITIKNNMSEKIDDYSIYIPVPKKHNNYGLNYQDSVFEWSLNLLEELETSDKFNIMYSSDLNENLITDPTKMLFTSNVSNLKNITMIKISSTKPINPSEEYTFIVKLEVDNNISNNKNSKLNIWNPVSYVESSVITGEVKGSKVATKLYAPAISGLVYLDINKNKIYDKNIDIPGVNDIKIELYKKEEQKVKIADINVNMLSGEFNYLGDKSLKNGNYSIKLESSLYQINSDVVADSWIEDIIFKTGEGYYYEIGYITDEFAPTIKAEDAYIYVGDKIEFEKYIKEAYDYKKEKINIVFGENSSYQSDIPNKNAIATNAGTYYVSYEVIDNYGNKATSLIKIYVRQKSVVATTSKSISTLPPSTGDNIIINIIIAIISIIVMLISIYVYKKIKANK